MNGQPFGTGAHESPVDPRTIKHEDLPALGVPLPTTGGVTYSLEDIENQHKVGICTAISLVQNRQKANGRKYSPDFQYLLQKKYYDGNWIEGSSIFSALKAGKGFGFLPAHLWTHTTEQDRLGSYAAYVAKLKAVPDAEVNRLVALCVDKIPGYASVNAGSQTDIAKAIDSSEVGVLCMYGCGDTWWLPSWLPSAINPLRKPVSYTSYHAIGMTFFDYSRHFMQLLANTWGTAWNMSGNADINYNTYAPIEVWTILRTTPVIPPYKFNKNLWFGMSDPDVVELQRRLGIAPTDVHFGPKTLAAVIKYQTDHGITPAAGYVGPITRAKLNA